MSLVPIGNKMVKKIDSERKLKEFFENPNQNIHDPIDPYNDLLPPAYKYPLNHEPPMMMRLTRKDVDDYRKEKIKICLKLYEQILNKCYNRIKRMVRENRMHCIFTIPDYMIGYPIYDVYQCIYYVIKKLKEADFQVKYIPKNTLFISWKTPVQKQSVLPRHTTFHPAKKMLEEEEIFLYG